MAYDPHRPRRPLHMDADAFFASVEQAADPRLRGIPMAVGGEKRGIIASASYEARQFGIYTPMPTVRARKLCPHLIVLPGDFEKYERFSRWMFSYAYDFTSEVEITSIDEGYLDLCGCRKPPHEIAATLQRAIHQSLKITVSEGIASNKLVSQIASKLRKPAALIQVLPGQERSFLRPLPNRWLPGIGAQTAIRMNSAGLTRIGQIAETPVDFLSLLVGRSAPTLRDYANGIDARPIVTTRPDAKSYSHQETFAEDLTDEAYIEATLRKMADSLMQKVRRDGKLVRTLTVKVRYNDMLEDQRSESLLEPTDIEDEIYGRLRIMLRLAWKRRVSLRLVSLKFSQLYNNWAQAELPLFQETIRREARSRLARTVDQLRESRGKYVIMRGHDLLLARGRNKAEKKPPAKKPAAKPVSRTRAEPYVPLHCHSYYSFLDSTLSPAELVALAREQHCPAIALSDSANLHGAVPFYQAAKAAGLRPIIGAEIKIDGKPLLLYVENERGYQNLCQLLSEARSSLDGLALDSLTAIAADPALARYFAPDAFFLGAASAKAIYPSAHPWVAVPGIHYAQPADQRKHQIVQSIRTLTLLDQQHPDKKRGSHHFPSPEELAERFADFPEALANTHRVAARCDFDFDFDTLHFPGYRTPDGSTPHDFLRAVVLVGFKDRYGDLPRRGTFSATTFHTVELSPSPLQDPSLEQIFEQVETELSIIAEVGYEEYFLVVWDLLQECRRQNIEWITRGSAADSLVCYCLGISDVCPIRFDLYFRRFLNRERMQLKKLPDIDIDFAHDEKDRVVELLFEKYGEEHTACVGGFSTFKARSALGEVAKVLGVSEYQIRQVTKAIPHSRLRDLREKVKGHPACDDLPLDEEPYASALEMAAFLDGFPRYPKMHPCGIVLSRRAMRDHLPTFVSNKGWPTTHFDMDAAEEVGLIKMDILAQGGLAAIRDARAQMPPGAPPSPPRGDWSDRDVWEVIGSGQARAVHHIESPAMISLAKMIQVRDIDTLVAQVSIIRPGAANENKKQHFARCHQGMAEPEYPHPSVIDCLKGSYGHIVYEEQVLQVCEAFAGMSPGESDRLRRALVKQDMDKVVAFGTLFYHEAKKFGRTKDEIKTVWEFICGFMGYAFCKAHSTAYAVEAYEAAWLKCYHPAEFMAAVLSNGKGFYRPFVYVLECHRLGIPMLPPDVREPGPGFSVVEIPETRANTAPFPFRTDPRRAIRIPAAEVKGLNADTLHRMCEERALRTFDSLQDFYRRVLPDRDESEALLRIGAFDGFGAGRCDQFWELQWLRQAFPARRARNEDPRQDLLFPPPRTDRLPGVPLDEPSRLDRLKAETELLGFAASGHPLELYPDIDWAAYCTITELGAHLRKTVTCCGLIIEQRTHHQATGELMKFMTLCDWTGMVETELFAKTFRTYGLTTVRYPVLEVTARVEPFDNEQGFTLRVLRAARPRRREREVRVSDTPLKGAFLKTAEKKRGNK